MDRLHSLKTTNTQVQHSPDYFSSFYDKKKTDSNASLRPYSSIIPLIMGSASAPHDPDWIAPDPDHPDDHF